MNKEAWVYNLLHIITILQLNKCAERKTIIIYTTMLEIVKI